MATQTDFIAFIRAQRIPVVTADVDVIVTISTTDLPDNSPDITDAYLTALEIVSCYIKRQSTRLYDKCVYNLAMHFLMCFSQAPIFDLIKTAYQLYSQKVGFIGSAADEGTSASYTQFAKYLLDLTAFEMDLQRTQYGRTYFEIAALYQGVKNWL
jgi:hypothetical protein